MSWNTDHMPDSIARVLLRECLNVSKPIGSFALIRNPIEREFSTYNYEKRLSHEMNLSLVPNNFDEYVQSGYFKRHLMHNSLGSSGIPQSVFVNHATQLFLFESEDWKDFLVRIYPNISIPLFNQNTAKTNLNDVSARTIDILHQVYVDDFELYHTLLLKQRHKIKHSSSKLSSSSSLHFIIGMGMLMLYRKGGASKSNFSFLEPSARAIC